MDAGTDYVQERRNEMFENKKEAEKELIGIAKDIATIKETIREQQKEIDKYQHKLNQRSEQVDEVNKVLSKFGHILEKGKNRHLVFRLID